MSLLDNLLKPGLAAVQAITGDSFTMSGLPYFGTFDAERAEYTFEQQGQREIVRRTCIAAKAQWIAKPDAASRDIVVFQGSEYVLTAIGEDGVHYVLTLEKRT
jgi:hypothetical protein